MTEDEEQILTALGMRFSEKSQQWIHPELKRFAFDRESIKPSTLLCELANKAYAAGHDDAQEKMRNAMGM